MFFLILISFPTASIFDLTFVFVVFSLKYFLQLVSAGISQPWKHLGAANRPGRWLLSCLLPVKVDQTAGLFVSQQRAAAQRAELIYCWAAESKAGSLLECQNLLLGLCLEGKSSSQGQQERVPHPQPQTAKEIKEARVSAVDGKIEAAAVGGISSATLI